MPLLGEGDAFAYFFTPDVQDVLDQLAKLIRLSVTHPDLRLFIDRVDTIITRFFDALTKIALDYSALSEAAIVRKMLETKNRNRPFTGQMETHIKSLPGPLGTVHVALYEELDKIINANGEYGTFWRAQEYGTGQEGVPSQQGRVIRGFFEPSGTSPDGALRGIGVGTDLAFEPDGTGTYGTINFDLPGRHFLRDGSAEAGAEYVSAIEKLATRTAEEIRGVAGEMKGALAISHSTSTYIIDS